jgi:hypothetical protein
MQRISHRKKRDYYIDYLTFFNIFITICVNCQMEYIESKEEIYNRAKSQHELLERRLQMLMKKPYLTAEEELEIRVLKKKKLFLKDTMDNAVKLHEAKETE